MTAQIPLPHTPPPDPDERSMDPLLDMLDLEQIDTDLYRGTFVFAEPYSLYGGQVAAQALRAAGLTIPADRLPHSLHGYFLRPGDASRPTVFRVDRDRDGGSFSARRVVAIQNGAVIFNMSTSFHTAKSGQDRQVTDPPPAPRPEECQPFTLPRVFSLEGRRPEGPGPDEYCPIRFWARSTPQLGEDPLLHACVLTYLSDITSGLFALEDGHNRAGASLDHAVWFHRPVRMDDWVLMDNTPHSVAAGRGWYTGSVFDGSGRLAASFAQEALFRPMR
ncbi:acyl-CoA thioesterase [Peterkaempfera bronchialis]|nr:acyl-CoA thioesterase domain-containing protein [Peterkaempfera bronchialis]